MKLRCGIKKVGASTVVLDFPDRQALGSVNVRDFGAVGDGITDDTAAIQAAINTQYPVKLGVARYLVTDTLTFPLVSGSTVRYAGIISGSGMVQTAEILDGSVIRGTILVTPATFAKPLFYAYSSRDLIFKDFTVYGPGKAHAGSIAFHFNRYNRYWKFSNIAISDWQTGIQSSGATAAQGNDSECMYDNVHFNNITYCTRMYNSQAYNWHFYGCCFDPTTDYTCKVETAGGYSGNKIRLHGCHVGSTVKIFDVRASQGHVSVEGSHFESGAVGTDPPTIFDAGTIASTASVGCTLIGNEFNYGSCKDDTTTPFIQTNCEGPLVMTGNTINHPNPLIMTSKSIVFNGNYWMYEPQIYRSDALTIWPPSIEQGEFYLYYNGVGGDSVARVPQFVPFRYKGMTETYDTAVPTTGSYRWGAKIWKTDVAAGGSPGWVCTESGTYSAATDNTGDTDGSTNVITGMTDTSDFFVGEYVDVSAGFAGTGPYLVVSKTATSLTLDTNSNAAQANITVNTSDPVWKALANVAA